MQKRIKLGAALLAIIIAATMFSGFAPVSKIGVPDTASKPKTTPAVGLGITGAIKIPNTRIDYNVVVATNNEYYMTRDEAGKKDVNGAIFLDFRNLDASRRRNLIIYGHNMKSGKMFADMHKFEDRTFFNTNRTFEVTLFGKKWEYQLIAVGQYNISKFRFDKTQFKDDAEFTGFVGDILAGATFKDDAYTPTKDDQILTLATCVQGAKTNRWVGFARCVKELPLPSPTRPPNAVLS